MSKSFRLATEVNEMAESYGSHWTPEQIKEHNIGLRKLYKEENKELATGLPTVLVLVGITVSIFYLVGLI